MPCVVQVVKADAYVGALDVPGAKKMIPQPWRRFSLFSNIDKLVGVPVITVQLRYNGWVTEMLDPAKAKNLQQGAIGIDNLLYRYDDDCGDFQQQQHQHERKRIKRVLPLRVAMNSRKRRWHMLKPRLPQLLKPRLPQLLKPCLPQCGCGFQLLCRPGTDFSSGLLQGG